MQVRSMAGSSLLLPSALRASCGQFHGLLTLCISLCGQGLSLKYSSRRASSAVRFLLLFWCPRLRCGLLTYIPSAASAVRVPQPVLLQPPCGSWTRMRRVSVAQAAAPAWLEASHNGRSAAQSTEHPPGPHRSAPAPQSRYLSREQQLRSHRPPAAILGLGGA